MEAGGGVVRKGPVVDVSVLVWDGATWWSCVCRGRRGGRRVRVVDARAVPAPELAGGRARSRVKGPGGPLTRPVGAVVDSWRLLRWAELQRAA